jgi:thiamine-phosphate pyrophosphorylase
MHRRQPLPRLWMMTDERQGDALFEALGRLPRGAGVVFRHYGLAPGPRRELFLRVRAAARRRRLVLMLAGTPRLAAAWGADGSHGLAGGIKSLPHLLRSAPVHDPAELVAAAKAGADFVFLSPAFATRSHAGARPLGPVRVGLVARASLIPVIALGGMDAVRAQGLGGYNIYGWAGIDAWQP